MACDELFASVVALLHFDGADASTTFTEVTGKTATAYGNAQIDTAQSVFGGASLLLDGAGDYLTFPDSADFDFGAGDFSIEVRVRFANWAANNGGLYNSAIVAKDVSGGRSFALNVKGTAASFTSLSFIGFSDNATYTEVEVAYSFALNTNYAIECTRIGNLIYLFVDGVLLNPGGTAFSRTLQTTATTLRIGALEWDATYKYYLNGWLDELRITKGVGRNSASYTPAAVAFADAWCVIATPAAPTTLTVVAVDTPVAPTTLTVDPSLGTPTAPTTLTVEASLGTPTAPTTLTVNAIATPVAPTTLTVVAVDTPVAPTTLTVSWPTGTPAAPTTLTVTATGTPTAPTTLAVIPAAHVPNWTARCIISGVDMSARLVGQARVPFAEGAARIASVTLLPSSGTIEPLDYVGKTITLDYVLVIGATEVARRLFTGRVDTPAYDPSGGLLTLTCTDDIQNIVAGLPRATLDSLIAGRYAAAVQGEIDDNWDYAQALMSTVSGSLDASPSGGLRVTPWEIADTWATFGDGDMLYQRMGLSLPQRSTLINSVSIEFDYRYPRLRQRFTTLGWSGTQIDMRPNGWQYPTQQDILGAANGSGWTATLGVFYPAPAAVPYPGGGFIYPPDGSIDMAIIHLAQRHSQTVTEGYAITVTATESVTANGELPSALRGALESTFDGGAWESALDVEPLMPSGGEQDYAPDADRAAADHALQTLLDQARVKILGSHRSARVSNTVLCNPDLDLDKKIAIATTSCTASGKVAEGEHVLDFDAGSAITEFSIAISGVGGAGIITPDTLAPPPPPTEAAATQDWPGSIPSLSVCTYPITPYSENLMGLLLNPPETVTVEDVPVEGTVVYPNPYYVAGTYPVQGFRVRMPGVIDADRNPIDKPVVSSYQILVPADPLTFTVP